MDVALRLISPTGMSPDDLTSRGREVREGKNASENFEVQKVSTLQLRFYRWLLDGTQPILRPIVQGLIDEVKAVRGERLSRGPGNA